MSSWIDIISFCICSVSLVYKCFGTLFQYSKLNNLHHPSTKFTSFCCLPHSTLTDPLLTQYSLINQPSPRQHSPVTLCHSFFFHSSLTLTQPSLIYHSSITNPHSPNNNQSFTHTSPFTHPFITLTHQSLTNYS